MAQKRHFNQSKNFLYYLGSPLFKLLISCLLFASLLLTTVSHLSFHPPILTLPKVKLNFFKLKPHLFLLLILTVLFSFIYLEFFYNLPDPHLLSNYPSKLTTQILDRNGKLLYKIYKDENRTLITLDSLPQHVKNAFLAAEDKDFYRHNGFSLTGVFRALYKNIFDSKSEGGSTITQQLIKNTLLTNEKTLIRKIKELILAVEVELTFSKDKIFEMYLNQVGFGGPAYGIQEASRQYFNIDAKDLNLAQAAFLAGLPQAPSKYSPFGDQPELAKSRQQTVLSQMLKTNAISENDYQKALNQKLVFNSARTEIKAPHFVMFIKNILTQELGENIVNQGGLIVTTTLDLDLQEITQQIVTDEISKLTKYHVTNGAALVTNPKNGDILAMVGSKDYFNLNEDGQVNLTQALRQPGSSIKPLNYALAFENGYGPGSIIEDKPITFNLPKQEPWSPKNYDGKFHGIVTLRQALGSSYNIPSVILLSKNGIQNFANLAQKLGITSWNDPSRFGLSMALGSLEVRMTDMAMAYSAFANNGLSTPLKAINKIEKSDGSPIYFTSCLKQNTSYSSDTTASANEDNCLSHQVISSTSAYLITDILSDNNARTPAFGANSVLNIKKTKVAVKTGTSNELRDNWAFGYNKDFLVATWVGNNDNTPMSHIASGVTGASPIWSKIVNTILDANPQPQTFSTPDNLIKISICTLTGTLTCDGCPTKYEYFIKGTEPKTACDPLKIQEILKPTPSTLPTNPPQIL